MIDNEEILKLIYFFFPRNIEFESREYQTSIQNFRLLEKKKECLKNLLPHKFHSKLMETFKENEVINWTDLESNNSLEYRILLHKNQEILDDDIELMQILKGKRIDIFLFISILGKYYFYFINETLYDGVKDKWQIKKVFITPEEHEFILKNLHEIMNTMGYLRISNSTAKTVVSDIETELIDRGKVTIFNCLFTDMVTL